MYLTAAAPLQTQAETTAQLHEKKFLPGFAEDAWETASLDSKTELAKQLAAYELAMLGVPDGTEITVQPLDEDRLGYYSAASRQIVLSRSVLESGTAQETMDTIAHEAFHVQQAYVVETSTGTMPRPRRPTTTRPDDGCGTIRMGTSRARRTS